MSKVVQIKKYEDSEELYFDLEDLKDIIDISKVEYYDFEDLGDGSLALRVYDKDKNLIEPREEG